MNHYLFFCVTNILAFCATSAPVDKPGFFDIIEKYSAKNCSALSKNVLIAKNGEYLATCKHVSWKDPPENMSALNMIHYLCVGVLDAEIRLCSVMSNNEYPDLPKNYDNLKQIIDSMGKHTPLDVCNSLKNVTSINDTSSLTDKLIPWMTGLHVKLLSDKCVDLCNEFGGTNILCSMLYYINSVIQAIRSETRTIQEHPAELVADAGSINDAQIKNNLVSGNQNKKLSETKNNFKVDVDKQGRKVSETDSNHQMLSANENKKLSEVNHPTLPENQSKKLSVPENNLQSVSVNPIEKLSQNKDDIKTVSESRSETIFQPSSGIESKSGTAVPNINENTKIAHSHLIVVPLAKSDHSINYQGLLNPQGNPINGQSHPLNGQGHTLDNPSQPLNDQAQHLASQSQPTGTQDQDATPQSRKGDLPKIPALKKPKSDKQESTLPAESQSAISSVSKSVKDEVNPVDQSQQLPNPLLNSNENVNLAASGDQTIGPNLETQADEINTDGTKKIALDPATAKMEIEIYDSSTGSFKDKPENTDFEESEDDNFDEKGSESVIPKLPNESVNLRDYADVEESNFFTYFMLISVMFIAGYVVYHNKQKILALVLEGRRDRNARRRPNTASYRKLNSNLEEAVTSKCSASASHVIY